MKSLKSCLIIGLLIPSFLVGEAIAKPRKEKMCSYPIEENSKTYKIYVYQKFGISMVMPDNLVSMLLQDGSIDILDRGTYKLLQCPVNQRLGRGAPGISISWSNDTVYHTSLNIKKNVDLYVKKQSYNTYLIILRLINKKGQLIDIRIYDEGPIDDSNAKVYIKEYIELGRTIKFLD
ncbi:hypothetical protein IQ231_10305 [Cuspidothrix issatschenkoi LEGE 03284]|jgi:hypothetical protein|uniref:hypothetical protein n=1 Tax=Cuspidothrix issatschenkoi TaxID=230752 RepID=UPI00187EC246|nr:hypothetical protein [Cuspidothrix issatschenkoi]MBE9232070.1 hypothetical protein [Cuspidothrix issatschenkoi LEGE 03284]